MPADFSIAVRPDAGNDTIRAERERGERRQSMRGFEDTYTDIVDYIVRITHRIWEDQDVGYIYDTYAPGCFVYDDSGPNYGVEQVVAGTIKRINAFPDTRHVADEVIWAGNDEQGFVTSHRYVTPATTSAPGGRVRRPAGRSTSGASPTAWSARTRSTRSGSSTTSPPGCMQLGIDVGRGRPRVRQRGDAGAGVADRDHRGPAAAAAAGSPSTTRPSDGRGFDVEHFVRAALARHVQPSRSQRGRPGLRTDRALERHRPTGSATAARDVRAHGPQPAGDLPRPRHARRRGLLDGQRRRGLSGVGALDARRAPIAVTRCTASRPAAGCTSGASASCTSSDGRITEDWSLLQRVRRAGPAAQDDPTPRCRPP